MSKKRRWIPILLGVLVLFVFIGIGAVIASVAWFQQHVQTQRTSEADAEAELEKVRKQFAHRPPILELQNNVPRYTGGKKPDFVANAGSLESLNVLVWSPREDHLTRVTLPYWLLRMKSDPIRFSQYASGLDDEEVNLRPEDIEKFGPGILLDALSPSGDRVILWTQ